MTILVLTVFIASALGADRALVTPVFEGFESQTAPDAWQAGEGSRMSPTDTCFKCGKQSLRWQWERERATLTYRQPGAFAGAGKHDRLCFYLWVYSTAPGREKLRFEIGTARDTHSTFDFGLDYKGWRVLYFSYRRNLSRPPRDDADTMRIIAPEGMAAGTLYFDMFCPTFTAELGFLAGDKQMPWVNSQGTNHWVNYYYHFRHPWPIPPLADADVTPKMLADMRSLTAHYLRPVATGPGKGLPDTQYAQCVRQYEGMGIRRHGDIITGRPVVARNILRDADAITFRDYLGIMGRIGAAYQQAERADRRGRLKQMFFDLCDHLHEQGFAEGSVGEGGMHHFGYTTRGWPGVIQGMAAELAETGRLDPMIRAMNWYNVLHEIKAPDPVGNADTYLTKMRSMLVGILMLPDGGEKATWLRCFSRWLSKSVRRGVSDPDGAFYHHNMVHPGYTFGGVVMLAEVIHAFSRTSFRIEAAGHQRVKDAVFAHTFVCHPEVPRGVANRCPGVRHFDRGQKALLSIALAGTPDGTQSIDRDMAGLWLALNHDPDDEQGRRFREAGIAPAPLTGHYALQGACVSAHRRDQWLVTVDGSARFRKGTEFYGWTFSEHSWARYLNLGTIQILSKGEPMTREANGWPVDGWDYRHWPGTTAVALPDHEIYCYYGATKNRSAFAGGCDLEGNGVWGMIVDALGQQARKSVFLFENRLVCLGSAIANGRDDHPTVTTLFQTALSGDREPILVNGDTVSSLPYRLAHRDRAVWLMDTKGNGYYVPRQDEQLVISRRRQTMTYYLPKYYKPGAAAFPRGRKSKRGPDISKLDPADFNTTEADYSIAWFDHGTAPRDARYHYAILVDTDRESMEAFAEALAQPDHRPYDVIRHDNAAHLVLDRASTTWGCAAFEDDVRFGDGTPLRRTGRSCLIMVKATAAGMTLAVASSDRERLDSYEVTLNGEWRLERAKGDVTTRVEDGATKIVIPYVDYRPVRVVLREQPEAE